MGDAPKLLGGATFALESDDKGAEPSARADLHDVGEVGWEVLSLVVSALRRAGYTTTKPRRGKPDGVRCRCDRNRIRIELILIMETAATSDRRLCFLAFDFSKATGTVAHFEASNMWDEMCGIIHALLSIQFNGGGFKRLTAAEADAHCSATLPSE